MKFFRDSLITMVSRTLTLLSGAVVLMVTARVLGSEGRGVYAMVILVVTVLRTLGGLGIEVGNVYYTGRSRLRVEELISNSLVFSVVLGALVVGVFTVLIHFSDLLFLKNVPKNVLIVGVLALPFFTLSIFISYIFLGKNNVTAYNLLNLLQPAIFAVLIVFLLIVFKTSLLTVICFWAAIHVFVSLLSVRMARKLSVVDFAFYPGTAKKTIQFGLKAYLANILQFLHYRFDFFLINKFLNLSEVGYYSVAVTMAELLLHIPYAAGIVVLPRVSNSTAEEANKFSPEMSRHIFFLLITTTLLFSLSAKFLFPWLFSDRFNSALTPYFLLLPGIIALGSSKVIANDLAGRGKPQINMYIAGITFFVNIGLNLFFIPKWGINGAAISSSITYSLATIIQVIIFKKISKTRLHSLFIIKKSDFRYYKKVYRNILTQFRSR